MSVPITDTSFVLALVNQNDRFHEQCKEVYKAYEKVLLPASTLNEISYMIQRDGRVSGLIHFLTVFSKSKWQLEHLTVVDLERTGELLNQYQDTRLDFVDLSIVSLCERLNIDTILTLDIRDFSYVRPKHIDYFTLLPTT